MTSIKGTVYNVNFSNFCYEVQGFFQPFWEGALGPFALGNFRYFDGNWENFFNLFYMIFLNRDHKTALNH